MADENEERGFMSWAEGVVSSVVSNGYLGGELQAAARQGFNELGAALKAFPDSIQIDEPGATFNPLYRDLPGDSPALPSPAEIASQSPVYGESQQESVQLPSPSEIANQQYPPEQGSVHGQELEQGHER